MFNQEGNGLLILTILLLIASGLLGGYFLTKNRQPTSTMVSQTMPVSISKPTMTPNTEASHSANTLPNQDISTWKLYSDSELGYSIKYPSEFYLDPQYTILFIRSPKLRIHAVSISMRVSEKVINMEDFIENEYFTKKITLANFKTQETIIDNLKAFFLEIKQGVPPKDYLQDFMFIQKDDNHMITLSSFPIYNGDTDENKILFDQILSTLTLTQK